MALNGPPPPRWHPMLSMRSGGSAGPVSAGEPVEGEALQEGGGHRGALMEQ